MLSTRVWTIGGSLFITCTCAYYLLSTAKLRSQKLKRSYDPFAPPALVELPPQIISIATLGHRHVYQDYINLWLLQVLMDETTPNDVDAFLKLTHSIIKHEPPVETLYLLSCIVLFEKMKRPDECQRVSLAGLEVFPDSWRIPILQGYVHVFMLKEPAQAAAFFRKAGSVKNKPKWVLSLVERLLKAENLDSDDIQKSIEIMDQFPESASFRGLIKKMLESSEKIQLNLPATPPKIEAEIND